MDFICLMILPTYPGKIPQTSPFTPTRKEIPSETVCKGSGVSYRGMWVRSLICVYSEVIASLEVTDTARVLIDSTQTQANPPLGDVGKFTVYSIASIGG